MDRSFTKGFKLVKAGKFERAIKMFEESIASNSENADAYNYIGLCHDAMGQHDKAIENYMKASEICERHGDEENRLVMELHRAESLESLGQDEESHEILRGILNADSKDVIKAQAASILAPSLCHSGRYEEAITMLEEARTFLIGSVIEGETFSFGILSMVRGYVEIQRGDFDSAFKYLDIARSDLLADESSMAELNNYFGEVYLGWNNAKKALEYFQKSWSYMKVHKPSWANSFVARNISRARDQLKGSAGN